MLPLEDNTWTPAAGIFEGWPLHLGDLKTLDPCCGSGQFRTDETVLQVAVARLLGYRWPAELDKDMELAEEARSLATACDDLLDLADTDGIVCIPAVRGEMKAEDRGKDVETAPWYPMFKGDRINDYHLRIEEKQTAVKEAGL